MVEGNLDQPHRVMPGWDVQRGSMIKDDESGSAPTFHPSAEGDDYLIVIRFAGGGPEVIGPVTGISIQFETPEGTFVGSWPFADNTTRVQSLLIRWLANGGDGARADSALSAGEQGEKQE
jgi:hypothetical protein